MKPKAGKWGPWERDELFSGGGFLNRVFLLYFCPNPGRSITVTVSVPPRITIYRVLSSAVTSKAKKGRKPQNSPSLRFSPFSPSMNQCLGLNHIIFKDGHLVVSPLRFSPSPGVRERTELVESAEASGTPFPSNQPRVCPRTSLGSRERWS